MPSPWPNLPDMSILSATEHGDKFKSLFSEDVALPRICEQRKAHPETKKKTQKKVQPTVTRKDQKVVLTHKTDIRRKITSAWLTSCQVNHINKSSWHISNTNLQHRPRHCAGSNHLQTTTSAHRPAQATAICFCTATQYRKPEQAFRLLRNRKRYQASLLLRQTGSRKFNTVL